MGVPWPGVWDGPLWTLIFELICYAAVAVLGVAGLMSKRWTIPTAFVVSLIGAAAVGYPVLEVETIPQMVTRFALTFSAGALLYQFRDRLPANWSLVTLSVFLVLAGGLLPNYRVFAALPLAYAVIVSGALLKRFRPQLRNDISYGIYIYGWPVQQLLAMMGLAWLPPGVFFVVATAVTIPLAAASWFLVEKHAMKLKRRVQTERAGSAGYVHALGAEHRQQPHRLLGRRTRLRRVDVEVLIAIGDIEHIAVDRNPPDRRMRERLAEHRPGVDVMRIPQFSEFSTA